MNGLFEMQWNAIRQTQQLAEQTIDAHRRTTVSVIQLGLDASLDAQQLGTELTRHWLQASVRTLELLYGPPDSDQRLQRPMNTFSDFLWSQTELVDRWFALLFAMERETVHLLGKAVRPWIIGPSELAVGVGTAETTNTTRTPKTTATRSTTMTTTRDTAERPADEAIEPETSTDHGVEAGRDESNPSEETPSTATDSKSLSLQSISGIGTAYEDRLEAVGITSVEALANADPEELAGQISLSEKRLREWIHQAKQRVQDV